MTCCRRSASCRDRAPRPSRDNPSTAYLHAFASQNTVSTPCISPVRPNSGYAVTSMRPFVAFESRGDHLPMRGLALEERDARRRVAFAHRRPVEILQVCSISPKSFAVTGPTSE